MELLAERRIGFSVSVSAVLEYEDVLLRPDVVPEFKPPQLRRFLDDICALAVHRGVHFTWRPTLSDPNDEIFLELAVAAAATHIVTYNTSDFSRARQFGLKIVTPHQLLQEIESCPH